MWTPLVTCKDFLDGISDYIDNDVPADLRRKLETHISECPNCWVVFDTTKKTIQIYKGMEAQDLPEDVQKRLLSAVERRMAAKGPAPAPESPDQA